MIGPMEDSSDKPLRRSGRKLGLRVPDPDFEDGEAIRWEALANRFQGKVWPIGGGLFLTDRRLIFVPNKLESRVFLAKTWSARLDDLDRADVGGGLLRTVGVVDRDGGTSRFLVGSREASVAIINKAIQAVKPRTAQD
jgi:hypothetical protein